MKVVIAIDSFKGCLTSVEANRAAAEGIRSVCPDAEKVQIPVSDGGEGFMEAFHAAIGGEQQEVIVRDPLMRPISAKYLLRGEEAVIEIAQASGLTLLTQEERNPLVATSYGTGQLVADAVKKGARHIIVGLGGSATSDAGIGMLRALIDAFAKHGTFDDIKELRNVRFTIASDVRNPLCGENGAAFVFAPQKFAIERGESDACISFAEREQARSQNKFAIERGESDACISFAEREQARLKVKGATPAMIRQLDERARKFAEISAKHFGYDRSEMEGAGAAGGLGYAFLQYMDAECRPGIELLLETIDFKTIVKDADLVITGEGSADRQTLMGKLPMGILKHSNHSALCDASSSKVKNVSVCLIAGKIRDKELLLQAGFSIVKCINPSGISLENAMRKEVAIQNIRNTVKCFVEKIND